MTKALPVPAGTLIAGQYRVDELLGEGGMGLVLAARDVHLERDVAIKLIHPEREPTQETSRRFQREARITANLRHRGIVTVYAAGVDERGQLYLVQELLCGRTLRAEIDARAPWGLRRMIEVMLAVLDALAAAHGAGVVHRDIKPENVFISNDERGERVVLMDFGIAKELRPVRTRSALTAEESVIGTAEYLSPEQCEGSDDVDARADVWACGVMLYELLTDQTPWVADSWPALVNAIVFKPLPDVRAESRWRISDDVANVLSRALERDRARRYASAAEFLDALRAVEPSQWADQSFRDRRALTPEERARVARRAKTLEARRAASTRAADTVHAQARVSVRRARAQWAVWSRHRELPRAVVGSVDAAVERGARWASDVSARSTAVMLFDVHDASVAELTSAGFVSLEPTWWLWPAARASEATASVGRDES